MSRGHQHTYGTKLPTDTPSCGRFTVAAKGQKGEQPGQVPKRKKLGDRDMQREGEEKGEVKLETGMWKEGVRRKDESRWKMAEGQHADCPGPDWHILGRLTDGEKE